MINKKKKKKKKKKKSKNGSSVSKKHIKENVHTRCVFIELTH